MAKLTCEIEHRQGGGITVTVQDSAGGRTQTIHLDGIKVVLKVKGKSGSSTIVQEEGKVKIEANSFEVDAEEITLKTKKSTSIDSKGKVTFKSLGTMTMRSNGDLIVNATKKMKLSGFDVTARSKTKAEISGLQLKLKGKAKAELAAPMVDVKAGAVAKITGSIVQNKAKAILVAQSNGIANVKGSLTNVSGMLVKLG